MDRDNKKNEATLRSSVVLNFLFSIKSGKKYINPLSGLFENLTENYSPFHFNRIFSCIFYLRV